ncbi:MAG: DMT family transporter [Ruminococcus sp.]|nr:DMT family transporter [Ruminococcus sp.]
MSIILGVISGLLLPIQTGVNTQLKKKVKSPYYASFVSFVAAFLFLILLLLITGQGFFVPFEKLAEEPIWIWFGGICGVIFLTGNILLLSNLDGVQTMILPVLGQIIMGLVIDSFGLFSAVKVNLTALRVLGALLVTAGVVTISLAKAGNSSTSEKQASKLKTWLWRIFGVAAGMVTAAQLAFNGKLGKVVGSPIKASVISYIVGIIFLTLICIVVKIRSKNTDKKSSEKYPWWIWTGGILGGIYILANLSLAGSIGVGTTVIVLLTGSTIGGLLVDHFGLLGSERKPVNLKKIIGVMVMIIGAAMIKLF